MWSFNSLHNWIHSTLFHCHVYTPFLWTVWLWYSIHLTSTCSECGFKKIFQLYPFTVSCGMLRINEFLKGGLCHICKVEGPLPHSLLNAALLRRCVRGNSCLLSPRASRCPCEEDSWRWFWTSPTDQASGAQTEVTPPWKRNNKDCLGVYSGEVRARMLTQNESANRCISSIKIQAFQQCTKQVAPSWVHVNQRYSNISATKGLKTRYLWLTFNPNVGESEEGMWLTSLHHPSAASHHFYWMKTRKKLLIRYAAILLL